MRARTASARGPRAERIALLVPLALALLQVTLAYGCTPGPSGAGTPTAGPAGPGAGSPAAPSATAAQASAAPRAVTPEEQKLLEQARQHVEAGDKAKARSAYGRLLHRFPDNLEGQRDFVELLVADGSATDTVAFLRDRLAARGPTPGQRFALAYALAREGSAEGMREARTLLDAALVTAPAEALLLVTAGEVAAALGDPKAAATLYSSGVAALQAAGKGDEELQARVRQAQLLQLAGSPEASAAYGEALARAEALGDLARQVVARNGLAALLLTQGDPAGALRSFEQALALADRAKDVDGATTTLRNLARLHEELWEDGRAIGRLHEVVQRFDAAGRPLDAALARLQAGELLARTGQLPQAAQALQAAGAAFQQEEAWTLVADTLMALGNAFRDNGRTAEARAAYAQALELREQLAPVLGDYRPLAEALIESGALIAESGETSGLELLERALQLSEKAGERSMIRRSARALAVALLARGSVEPVRPLVSRLEALSFREPDLSARLRATDAKWDEAIALAEEAVAPGQGLPAVELSKRYGTLLHLFMQRDAKGDARNAFAAAVAGRAAAALSLLERMRVRVDRGVPQPLLDARRQLDAREEGMRRIIASALSEEVERAWEERTRALWKERAAWWAQVLVQAPAHARLMQPEAVRAAAAAISLPAGEALLMPQVSSVGAVLFWVQGDHVEALQVEDPPDRDRMVALVLQAVRDRKAKGVQVVRLVPPPGGQDFDWGLPLAPAAVVPVIPPGAAGAQPATLPTEPVALRLEAPVREVFESETLQGRVAEVELDAKLLEQQVGPAVELLARAALYAGAAELRVSLPRGRRLVYRAP